MKNLVSVTAASLLSLLTAAGPAFTAAGPAHGATVPTTYITVNGDGGARTYAGAGAILGGGGNARYLMEYPPAQRAQILDYLFKPGYGASLQLLKLEIGGDGNSSDGAEPSVEHTAGNINCDAGYEFAIARKPSRLTPGSSCMACSGERLGGSARMGHSLPVPISGTCLTGLAARGSRA